MTRPHPPDKNGHNVAKAILGSQQVPEVFNVCADGSGLILREALWEVSRMILAGVCHSVIHRPDRR